MKHEHGFFDGPRFNVLVVDEDPAWRRALVRGLLDLDVRAVSCVSRVTEVGPAIAEMDNCIVLTELSLDGSPLGGLCVAEKAHQANVPVGFVAGCDHAKIDRIRAVPFLSKTQLNRASLRAFLRYLERAF
jgi:DNA-binding NtrC family response regulator